MIDPLVIVLTKLARGHYYEYGTCRLELDCSKVSVEPDAPGFKVM